MTSSSQSGSHRKFLWLAGGIVAVVGIYTAGWFYAANRLEATVLRVLSPNEARNVAGTCEDIDFKGFPFRIGMFCSKVTVDDSQNGISAQFGALRSTAAVYKPNHIVWELDSPVQISNPQGLSINADWTNFQSSLFVKGRGVERSSTIIQGLKASLGQGDLVIAADNSDMQLRQNGSDLDAAITLTGTEITAPNLPQILPKFTGIADVTLAGKAGLIDGSDSSGIRGSNGELRRLAADIGEGSTVIISGPFSFDADGLMSARLKMQIENLNIWADKVSQTVPELASTIGTAKNLLRALNGGGDSASVDLVIDRGRVTVAGLIKIGNIPAL
jgi:hypothetical protein